MNPRIFLGANVSIVLIALALILIPFAVVITSPYLLRGAFAVVSVAVLAGLGLFYASRKGDLNWLRSFEEGGDK